MAAIRQEYLVSPKKKDSISGNIKMHLISSISFDK
jgi:hypothetical protein